MTIFYKLINLTIGFKKIFFFGGGGDRQESNIIKKGIDEKIQCVHDSEQRTTQKNIEIKEWKSYSKRQKKINPKDPNTESNWRELADTNLTIETMIS